MRNALQIAFLGGIDEIGKNMTCLVYNDDILVVDCGMSFPNEEMPGVDVVIPDITFLKQNQSKVRGIILTHGHEDHIGAVPYILKQLNVPVFGTRLTLMLLDNKLREHRLDNVRLNCIKEGGRLQLGCFQIEALKVSHSIAGALAFAITTPVGVVFFSGDFKIDYTPVDGQLMDFARFAEIGKRGVQLLLMESTNVERKGYTMSERTVGASLDRIFGENPEQRLIVATFASNVHRLQQIIDIAKKYGRKVCFSGRSMINVADAATRIGELKLDPSQVVDVERINRVPDKNLVILSTGSQGEPMSALTRMASGDFNKVHINKNDTIVISASPIPGNEKMVYRVINNLTSLGAKVIYAALAEVHVSGHACQEELKLMHSLLKPRYFIPVHGESRHLIFHKELAKELGMREENIFIPSLGACFELDKRGLKKVNPVPAGSLLVDGLGVGDVGSVVLRDRRHLAEDGMIVLVFGIDEESGQITSGPDVISRGFSSSKESEAFIERAKEVALSSLARYDLKNAGIHDEAKRAICRDVKNYLYKKTKRSPMILPIFVD